MKRLLIPATIAIALSLAAMPAGAQEEIEAIEGYTLIGFDGADAVYPIGGQPDPSGLFGPDKVEILRLDGAVVGDTFHLRMSLPGANQYGGLGSHMWAVHFDVDGTSYAACWTIITAGTTTASNDVAENTRGCSKFSEATAGPRTRADGVIVEDGPTGWHIEWPIAVDSIGGVGATMENIRATSWARTGSASDPVYSFTEADVAPNEGTYTHVIGSGGAGAEEEPAPVSLGLALDSDNISAAPGGSADIGIGLNGTAADTANATINVTGLPDGFGFSFAGNNASDPNATGGGVLTLTIPEDAENGTHNLTITATLGEASESLNATLTIDASLDEDEAADELAEDDNATAQDAGDEGSDAAAVPSPGLPIALAVIAGLALAVRRRQ